VTHRAAAPTGAMALVLCASAAFAAVDRFDWFAASESVKIFEDGYGCPAPRAAIDVFGLRGESVSAQGVLAARAALDNVTVEVGKLLHEGKSAS
jgi:hypothetical protein